MADLFIDRFNSKAVASAYAAFNICVALLLLGGGNRGSFEVCSAMIVKPESAYTQSDWDRVNGFRDYQHLKPIAASLNPEQQKRYDVLDNLSKRGELSASISYIKPVPFYFCYCLIIAIYIMLGGLKAAAITDAVQGVLILVMSIILIPVGLAKVGGLHSLHMKLSPSTFSLVGTAASSEYAWYSIAAITFGSLIQIIGLSHNMSAGGSATNEDTARFGMISGGFTKRLVLIGWMFCGLLAIALLSGKISEPDQAWGALEIAARARPDGVNAFWDAAWAYALGRPKFGRGLGAGDTKYLRAAGARKIATTLSSRRAIVHRNRAGPVDHHCDGSVGRGLADENADHV